MRKLLESTLLLAIIVIASASNAIAQKKNYSLKSTGGGTVTKRWVIDIPVKKLISYGFGSLLTNS